MWKTIQKTFDSPDSYVSLALGLAVVLVAGMLTFNFFKARTQQAASTEQQKTEDTVGATLPVKHKVAAGETLWSISEKYYKSGYNWVDIAKANTLTNADSVAEGVELTIPDVKPIVPKGEISSAQTTKKEYTVQKGDSLWKIAVANYQNGYRWPEIARANNLKNPNVIHAGNVLVLP